MDSSSGLGSAVASSESRRHLPVHQPHSQPEAEQACGCPHGRPVPESGPWGSPGVAQWHQPLAPNRRLSVTVLALQRGGQCQGLGRPSAARASGTLRPRGGRPGKPLPRSPASPCSGEESTLLCSRNCKIKFPRCSGPRSSRVLSGEEVGIGESRAVFSPAHPAAPVPPSTAGAVNHGPRRGPPPAPASLLPSDPRPHLGGQPWGRAGPREGQQVPEKP